MITPDLTRWATPRGSALEQYEQYWQPTTDAPREYLVPCALAVIGTTIGTNVYVPFGGDRIYANTWQIILGQAPHIARAPR